MGEAAHYGGAERDGLLGGTSSGGGVGDGFFLGSVAVHIIVLYFVFLSDATAVENGMDGWQTTCPEECII